MSLHCRLRTAEPRMPALASCHKPRKATSGRTDHADMGLTEKELLHLARMSFDHAFATGASTQRRNAAFYLS